MSLASFRVAVGSDGRSWDVLDAAGGLVASCVLVVPGSPVADADAESGDLLVARTDALLTRVSARTAREAWSLTVDVDNLTPEPVAIGPCGLHVVAQPPYALWTWTADRDGLIALLPTDADGPGCVISLVRGHLATSGHAGVWSIAPAGGLLGGHRRHHVTLAVSDVFDVDEVAPLLPAWLPRTIVGNGEPIAFDLPDAAIDVPFGVRALMSKDLATELTSAGGRHRVRISGPAGVHRVEVVFAPEESAVLADAAGAALTRSPSVLPDAAGVVVSEALQRGMWREPAALDWLEREDWLARGTILASVVAGRLAVHTRDRRLLADVWQALEDREPGPGYGIAVLAVWLAQLAGEGQPPAEAAALLGRRSTDPATALELALLSYRSADVHGPALAGQINLLGGPLPGRGIGLTNARAAVAASVLGLCPETWPQALDAAEAATKTERLLLADARAAVDEGRWSELDGLPWLLLGRLGM